MLSLLIVSLAAGVCYGQNDAAKFGDCSKLQMIASDCATKHLDYVKKINNDQYNQMLVVGQLEMPIYLLDKLSTICNNTMNLKEYFMCAYTNTTTCLENANSTEVMGVPDPKTISMGIGELCNSRSGLNQTCIGEHVPKVFECIGKITSGGKGMETCMMFTELVICMEDLASCKGGDAVKDYVISARPRYCPAPSSAQQYLPSVLLLLGVLLSHFVSFQ